MIDPIYTDSMLGNEDEWVPIRPGTDAALVEGMAYVMITENLVDQEFLDRYCIGYDEKTLPKSAPANSDYKSYILGKGPDGLPKTPQWAARETGVPSETIVRLAREIATTKPLFVAQGWGPQRHANGDSLTLAIAMLPILTGQIGLPGTNNGAREADQAGFAASIPVPPNPVKASICLNVWHRAITDAASMTVENGLAKNTTGLRSNIKFIWESQGNNVINQHTGSNEMAKMLRTPSLTDCFVVVNNMMTPITRFADYVLPDVFGLEVDDYKLEKYFEDGMLESSPEGFRSITSEVSRKEKKQAPLMVNTDKINEKCGTNFTEMEEMLLQIQMENDYVALDKWHSYAQNNDCKTFMLLFEKDFPKMVAV